MEKTTTLREYQKYLSDTAAYLLKKHGIAYLAMEVRTGKTLTAFATAQLLNCDNVLFVTRKKAIRSIKSDHSAMPFSFDIEIVNYESVHHHLEIAPKYDLIILDEAHCLGQYPIPSERTKTLKKICQGKYIIYLSGTPTPESYSQLYHQFWVSSRSPWAHYKNFYAWAKDYVKIRTMHFFNREVKDYSSANQELVEQATSHLFLTYTQEEAGFDQKVVEIIHHVRMHDNTYGMMNKLKAQRILKNKDGHIVEADTEVKLMNKLHQMCSGTVIIDKWIENDNIIAKSSAFDASKVKYILDRFAGKKIAIFYKFKAEETQLRYYFAGRIEPTPEDFNVGGKDSVYISQIQSGREGINLSTADAIIMLNIDFSAVSYWQARARLQNKDREKPAEVHWIFAEYGIEDKIYKAVMNKKNYTLKYFLKDYGIGEPDTEKNNQQTGVVRVVCDKTYSDKQERYT